MIAMIMIIIAGDQAIVVIDMDIAEEDTQDYIGLSLISCKVAFVGQNPKFMVVHACKIRIEVVLGTYSHRLVLALAYFRQREWSRASGIYYLCRRLLVLKCSGSF